MQYTEQRFHLKGISPILGSISMDKNTFLQYLATKGKTPEECAKAAEDVENVVDAAKESELEEGEEGKTATAENKATGFYRNENGEFILKEYQIKGFLKEAARCLSAQLGLVSPVSKIDNFVFINERNLLIHRADGSTTTKCDSLLERPLRAMTAQGPRVAISYSEMLNDWEIEFTLKVLKHKSTAKSVEITMDTIKELLAYGELKGLLQWRNGGYGQFTFEPVGEEVTVGSNK